MDESTRKLIENLSSKIDCLSQAQEEFYQKHFLKLSTASKPILTQPEAADYIGLTPNYLNQLTHHGKLKFIKKKGMKSKYFLKRDLDEYLMGNSIKEDPDSETENDILNFLKRGKR
ncbi:helix-turn-helix domain-containing protein [Albibacterium indicum]|uniref:helix-turn-helix domain-containing protein n=1 Tax=Albibacterium indicum TaxID=2292082 RepID=UPI0013003E83|nr:helix-turn-helix domain-containing protein [Pedobacter indicus]